MSLEIIKKKHTHPKHSLQALHKLPEQKYLNNPKDILITL